MQCSYSIEIERSQQDVFDFVNEPSNIKLIVPNLVDEGLIEETPDKVGTTFWHEYEENGRKMKMTGVVTEYERPTRSAVELDGPMFSLGVLYEYEALGPDRMRLTQHSNGTFKHVFKLLGLLMGKKMKRDGEKVLEDNFARLKSVLEGGSKA